MTPFDLATALGAPADASDAALVALAWGGWMLTVRVGALVLGYPIANHATVRGIKCAGLNAATDNTVCDLLCAALASGRVWGRDRWHDLTDHPPTSETLPWPS